MVCWHKGLISLYGLDNNEMLCHLQNRQPHHSTMTQNYTEVQNLHHDGPIAHKVCLSSTELTAPSNLTACVHTEQSGRIMISVTIANVYSSVCRHSQDL